ncbi:hypothetical protein VMCG_03226 [Cytospora schulzeri]|uniref:Uncharacterized protein n=1 Tax=Cytospora schulzeri TaxID=448051 RepID=A0A423WXX3_9PEZI|nr:hypothetical protein VMCG_03226 [Valsa malicola]
MISTEVLAEITDFCSTTSKSAPSPPLQKGDIYCLSSFAKRAEQWYKQEAGRQVALRCREASSTGKRRQPSRTAKDKFHACDYVLPGVEVDALLHAGADDKTKGNSNATSKSRLLTPPDDKAQIDLQGWDPEVSIKHFQRRLSRAIQKKIRELKSRYEPEGIKHLCTVADLDWDCVDEEYCGHGLVDRCFKWVPKKANHLRPRMRVEMEDFFSAKTANNQPERLKELKKYRYSKLKKATLEKLEALEVAMGSQPEAMMEAEMLESPTLGRWPGTPGFLKEDIKAQTVKIDGLTFAVDVCLGEPRIMML